MSDAEKLRKAAKKGLLGTQAFSSAHSQDQSWGEWISTNVPWLAGDPKSHFQHADPAYGRGNVAPVKREDTARTSGPVRTLEQAEENERLLDQGYTPDQILSMELQKKRGMPAE